MFTLRDANSDDLPFLWKLHVSAMRDYVEATYGWDETDQKRRFDAGFQPDAIQIIEMEKEPIGMWETNQEIDPWFLARVVVSPSHQRKGVGSYLIEKLLAEADIQKRQVTLQVMRVNPAKSLYERLGFVTYEETDTHFKMLRASRS